VKATHNDSQNSISPYARMPKFDNPRNRNQNIRIQPHCGTASVQYPITRETELYSFARTFNKKFDQPMSQALEISNPCFRHQLTVTHNHQYAQPRANARQSSMNRSAYSMKEPVTGIIVAISPRDCLDSLAKCLNYIVAMNHPHNKEYTRSNQAEANQSSSRTTLSQCTSRIHQ